MEETHIKPFFCNIHSNEPIERVAMRWDAAKQLYCTHCILNASSKKNLQLKTLNEYIDSAAQFYSESKPKNISVSGANEAYSNILQSQASTLAALSEHLEKEKSKIEDLFETITKDVTQVLFNMKREYLNLFDEQLVNLRYSYTFFEKQVKRVNPAWEDISLLFPSKQEINQKLRQTRNTLDLSNFVRNVNDDIHEYQTGTSSIKRTESQKYLDLLAQEVTRVGTIRPKLKDTGIATVLIKSQIQEYIDSLLANVFVLEDQIPNISQTDMYIDSHIITPEQFDPLYTWLPDEYSSLQGLLYRATRDGMAGSEFHKLCDRKGATLTLIKCQYEGSEKESIIGGFLDKDWTCNGYIASENAFMFSLTTKTKCTIKLEKYAAAGYSSYGPMFGGGHDLKINSDGTGQFCPHSYHDAMKLIEGIDYAGRGKINMKIFEVEVYSIGSK